ncbi:hypothetical protein [Campylobacter sp. RM12651]|uniref:hypothetical protein n=1 Tax=Campylobacter sp. RM12651 TaxID=1660079 RepID=UPI001EFBD77A|nr:hypothetical protein [Campylobacter sp. RM12651]ULO03765.1 hypothetical protein AVBRAN_1311 [Campylobacter sp. RM12651]
MKNIFEDFLNNMELDFEYSIAKHNDNEISLFINNEYEEDSFCLDLDFKNKKAVVYPYGHPDSSFNEDFFNRIKPLVSYFDGRNIECFDYYVICSVINQIVFHINNGVYYPKEIQKQGKKRIKDEVDNLNDAFEKAKTQLESSEYIYSVNEYENEYAFTIKDKIACGERYIVVKRMVDTHN